jgi:hypothetical protein
MDPMQRETLSWLPNVAVQRPTRVGANFAQAKFVTTKEVRCNVTG